MNLKHRVQGKISSGTGGMGTPTQGMVEERAKEIAIINGRDAKHVSDADREEARRELTGVANENREIESDEPEPINSGVFGGPPGSSGEKADRIEVADEQTYAQQLVEEGANEAEHDRMVEGVKHGGNQS